METARIVHALPPSRRRRNVRPLAPLPLFPAEMAVSPARAPAIPVAETGSGAALRAFDALATRWRLSPGQAWTVLTGEPSPAPALDAEQARRVALLLAIEAKLATVLTRTDVGTWMAAPNPAPLLMGRSPLEFLSRTGTPGFLSLLRQARRWGEL